MISNLFTCAMLLHLSLFLVRESLEAKRHGYKSYSRYKGRECKVGMYLRHIYYSKVFVSKFLDSGYILDTVLFPLRKKMSNFYFQCFRV